MAKLESRVTDLEEALGELTEATEGILALLRLIQRESQASTTHAYTELMNASRELVANTKAKLPPPS